jgi:hypothetical protein
MRLPRAAADADVLSGCVFMAIGAAAIIAGRNYDFGSLSRMGPGFFPLLLGGLLFMIGLAIAGRGLASPSATFAVERILPIVAIAGSLVAFGLTVTRFGFAAAIAIACLVAMAASNRSSILERFALPAALCVFCSLVFIRGLGLAVPLFKW